MNILVCIAKSVETTAKISFKDNDTQFDDSGVQYIMNPYDEWYSLVRALELKEQEGGEVHVVCVGDSGSDQIIRKALAIGADKAFRIDREPETADDTAFQLSEFVKAGSYDIVFTGKETVDYNSGLVPPILSALLDWPFVGIVSDLKWENGKATMAREIEGGVEIVSASLPLVLSATKDLAQQRIPNMRGIMMAKRKPLEVVEAREGESKVRFVGFSKPAKEKEITYVEPDNMDELVRLLNEEAKVI